MPAQRTRVSVVFTSAVRVLFTALLFAAAGMGAGLFLGIIGTVLYSLISGHQVDMSNAYRHVAFPIAVLCGSAAMIGAAVLEVRARQRTSR